MADPAVTRLHERVDDHATRIGQLEGWVKSLQNAQNKQDDRIEKVEQTNQQLLLSVAQVQNQLTSLERHSISLEKTIIEESKENRKIITQLLDYDQKRDEQLVNAVEADKGRNQERWLKVWSIAGPILGAAIAAWLGIKA